MWLSYDICPVVVRMDGGFAVLLCISYGWMGGTMQLLCVDT